LPTIDWGPRNAHKWPDFIQNQGTAHELAARFYSARSFDAIADTYLRNAQSCYARWGADGKVRQLEQTYPQLRRESSRADSTVATSAEQLDLTTVVKVSQAIFSGVDLNELLHTLMILALEHAGADRGLLILPWATAGASRPKRPRCGTRSRSDFRVRV
jgi:GAF domain-containing protein